MENDPNGRFYITHINLAEPERPYLPPTDFEAGFVHNLGVYGRSILSPEIEAIKSRLNPIFQIDPEAFLDAFLPLAHQVYEGKKDLIHLDDVIQAFQTADIKESTRQKFMKMLNEL